MGGWGPTNNNATRSHLIRWDPIQLKLKDQMAIIKRNYSFLNSSEWMKILIRKRNIHIFSPPRPLKKNPVKTLKILNFKNDSPPGPPSYKKSRTCEVGGALSPLAWGQASYWILTDTRGGDKHPIEIWHTLERGDKHPIEIWQENSRRTHGRSGI